MFSERSSISKLGRFAFPVNPAPTLPAYYCDIYQREDVSSGSPVPCDRVEALRTLNCVCSDRAFTGLILSERFTLQFARCQRSGLLRTEWLDQQEQGLTLSHLNIPLAEEIVHGAYDQHARGKQPQLAPLQKIIAYALVPWSVESFSSLSAA